MTTFFAKVTDRDIEMVILRDVEKDNIVWCVVHVDFFLNESDEVRQRLEDGEEVKFQLAEG